MEFDPKNYKAIDEICGNPSKAEVFSGLADLEATLRNKQRNRF